MSFRLFKVFVTALMLVAGFSSPAAQITVFAAASLTDSLKEIAAGYEKESSDEVVFNFAGSNLLARQIEEGAPVDIFFSADEAKMNDLEKKGLLATKTRKSLLSNSLVIVVSEEGSTAIRTATDLTNTVVKRVALADPKGVPAGIYAKEYLEKQKLWPAVEPKVVPTENVRAALTAVETGDVEAGIVYKTDAGISKKVKIAYEVAANDSPDISYPVAILKESQQQSAAKNFLKYLASAEAAKVFEKFGFGVRK